jgi:hypothetical protein
MIRTLTLVTLAFASSAYAQQPVADPFSKWDKEIAGIEKRLKDAPPKPGGVFFVGASSIRLWDLKKSFPDLPATNVGFGGSEIRDSTHFAARIILPYEPSTIVFYAGDNDIANKRTPKQVTEDFAEFEKVIHEKLPKCRILFIAVKPSPSRWKLYEVQTKANDAIRELCKKDDRLAYIDVVAPMLGKDGKPISELFQKDELHLNAKGYEIWIDLVNKALAEKR